METTCARSNIVPELFRKANRETQVCVSRRAHFLQLPSLFHMLGMEKHERRVRH